MTALLDDILSSDNYNLFDTPERLSVADGSQLLGAEIYCDGASSGNPGHAGIGVVIRIKKRQLISEFRNQVSKGVRVSEYIGIATNNVAEYTAFVR